MHLKKSIFSNTLILHFPEFVKGSLSFHLKSYCQRHIDSHVLKPQRWIVILFPVKTTTPIFCLLHAQIIQTPMTEPMTPKGNIIPDPAVHPHTNCL